jgi:oligosaccharide reducing-end xylanase
MNSNNNQGAYATGKYRNLFVEAGHSPEDVNARVNAAFEQLFFGEPKEQAIYFSAGSNANGELAYILDVANNDVRSEGMSYGMMLAVQLNKKAEFDALWNWAKTYMSHDSPTHPAKGYFSWSVKKIGTGSAADPDLLAPAKPQGGVGSGDATCLSPFFSFFPNDEMPAPDGEEYFATSLYFAANRWGSGSGIYNYKAEADRLLNDMKNREIITGNTVNGIRTVGNLFNVERKIVRFSPVIEIRDHTDPSYHLPAFYELWARWGPQIDRQFWAQAASVSRDFFVKAAHPVTGLTPEYANYDGSPWADSHNPNATYFATDSWRTAMNWSFDWAWWGKDARQQELSDRIQQFFESKGIKNYGYQFALDGTPRNTDHSPGLVAANAVAGLAATHPRAMQFVEDLWNTPVPSGWHRYYDGMVYMLALLHCSAHFRIWTP